VDPLLPSKQCCIMNGISRYERDRGERVTHTRFRILKSFGATVLTYDTANELC
jgi:hypothetical protein